MALLVGVYFCAHNIAARHVNMFLKFDLYYYYYYYYYYKMNTTLNLFNKEQTNQLRKFGEQIAEEMGIPLPPSMESGTIRNLKNYIPVFANTPQFNREAPPQEDDLQASDPHHSCWTFREL